MDRTGFSDEDALVQAHAEGDDTTEMEASYEKFLADMSLANLMELRAKVEPYHPQTVTIGDGKYVRVERTVVQNIPVEHEYGFYGR